MKRIKTAVIGAGNMGRNHARIYSKLTNLVGIADISERGRDVAKLYNTNFYSDYLHMLNTVKPDAVSVVVPTNLHKKIAIDCLQLGIPTLVEKPIAATVAEAKDMIEVAKKKNVVLMVGHVERFNPAIITLKKYLEKKNLGRIVNLTTIRVGINPPALPNSDVALDLSIHDIDIFNYLLNEFPKKKQIVSYKIHEKNKRDVATILLEYSGLTATIQVNWITPIKMRKLWVTGTKGYCEVDYIKQKLIVYDRPSADTERMTYSDFLSISSIVKKYVHVSKKEPLREEIIYFLKNKDNPGAFDYGMYALKALEILMEE